MTIELLRNRVHGTRYRVGDGGELQQVTGRWGRFTYWCRRSHHQARVKEVISRALQDDYQERGPDQALYNNISSMSPRVLDRTLLRERLQVKIGDAYLNYYDYTPAHVEFNLGSDLDNRNFVTLLRRPPGQTLRVNVRGELVPVNDENVYAYERRFQTEQVRNVVTRLIGLLEQRVTAAAANRLAIKHFLTKSPLTRMSREMFDRSAIAECSELEEVVDEEIIHVRARFKAALQGYYDNGPNDVGDRKKAIEDGSMHLCIAEFIFNQKLGQDLERVTDGGSGGARYARDRFGRKILVVKPIDEGPHGEYNPQWYSGIKRRLVGPRACLEGNNETEAELDAWRFDRLIETNLVPPTAQQELESEQFNGPARKVCSVQMFVDGCVTLGEFLGIKPWQHNIPRTILRSQLDGERRLPLSLAERAAIHNFGSGDIDAHFSNFLVKATPVPENAPRSLMFRLMRRDPENRVDEDEIHQFVDTFFVNRHKEDLLQELLASEDVVVGNNDVRRVTLIKHDGGASFPHHHPTSWLGTRFKHLFEVLPDYAEPFSDHARGLLNHKEQGFTQFLQEKGKREIENLMSANANTGFWTEVNKQRVWNWLGDDEADEILQSRLAQEMLEAEGQADNLEEQRQEWLQELERIRGTIQTRRDAWRLLIAHVVTDHSIRELLQVRSEDDFQEALAELGNE